MAERRRGEVAQTPRPPVTDGARRGVTVHLRMLPVAGFTRAVETSLWQPACTSQAHELRSRSLQVTVSSLTFSVLSLLTQKVELVYIFPRIPRVFSATFTDGHFQKANYLFCVASKLSECVDF